MRKKYQLGGNPKFSGIGFQDQNDLQYPNIQQSNSVPILTNGPNPINITSKLQPEFGLNYNHIAGMNVIKGIGAFLRGKQQQKEFNNYNKSQILELPQNPNTSSESLYGMKKGGWLKGAINPAHKGYCTPMSKSTCTGHRKAFALMMKHKHGFHKKQDGGVINQGKSIPYYNDPMNDEFQLADTVNYTVATGQNPNRSKQSRGLSSTNRELLNYLRVFNTRSELQGMSPEQRIQTFYDVPSNSPSIQQTKDKLKSLGYGPISTYQNTPNSRIQEFRNAIKLQKGGSYRKQMGGEIDPFDTEFEKGLFEEEAQVNIPQSQVQEKQFQENSQNEDIDNTQYDPNRFSVRHQYPDIPQDQVGQSTYIDNKSEQKLSEVPDLLQAFKRGISGVESQGNYNAASPYSSARGKYQFTEATREGVRATYFPSMSKAAFESSYKSNPDFQERVMDKYSNYLLQKYKEPKRAATAFFLGEGNVDKVNQPNYRPTKENATVGQYLNKFSKNFYQQGGPTTADSLALYNNAKQVASYYNNLDYKLKKTNKENDIEGINRFNDDVYDWFKGRADVAGEPYGVKFRKTIDVPKDGGYRKVVNKNQYYQREDANIILDMNAPMTLFDRRIAPQSYNQYENIGNTSLKGDNISLYQYDPIAVKPWNMLTPDERKIRISKYGYPKGYQQSNQKRDIKPMEQGLQEDDGGKFIYTPPDPNNQNSMGIKRYIDRTSNPSSIPNNLDINVQPIQQTQLPINQKQFKYNDIPAGPYDPRKGQSVYDGNELVGYLDSDGNQVDPSYFGIITPPKKKIGGKVPGYKTGGTYDVDEREIERLKSLGYKISIL